MFKRFQTFKQVGTLGKIASLLIITLICLFFALIIGSATAIIYASLCGIEISQVTSEVSYLRIYQTLTSLILFVAPALIYAFLFDNSIKDGLYLKQKTDTNTYLLALLAMLAVIPLTAYLTEWNEHLTLPDFLKNIEEWMRQKEDNAKALTEKMLITNNLGLYLCNIIVLAAIPAVAEELYFRATIQKMITGKRPILAALVAAVLFSAFHLQFYGFVPRLLLGFMLGFMLLCTQNILVSVAAHFFNNFIVVTLYYATGSDTQISDNMSIIWYLTIGLLSAAITIMLLRQIYKKRVKTLTP